MFCKNCGTKIEEGLKFCPNCGTQVQAPAAAPAQQTPPPQQQTPPPQQGYYQQPAQPAYQPAQPAYRPAPAANLPETTPILVLGILSLVFGSIVGIILGAIGRNKARAYVNAGGELSGKAKVGNILSKLGIIFGIIELVFIVIYAIIFVAMIAGGVSSGAFNDIFDIVY